MASLAQGDRTIDRCIGTSRNEFLSFPGGRGRSSLALRVKSLGYRPPAPRPGTEDSEWIGWGGGCIEARIQKHLVTPIENGLKSSANKTVDIESQFPTSLRVREGIGDGKKRAQQGAIPLPQNRHERRAARQGQAAPHRPRRRILRAPDHQPGQARPAQGARTTLDGLYRTTRRSGARGR